MGMVTVVGRASTCVASRQTLRRCVAAATLRTHNWHAPQQHHTPSRSHVSVCLCVCSCCESEWAGLTSSHWHVGKQLFLRLESLHCLSFGGIVVSYWLVWVRDITCIHCVCLSVVHPCSLTGYLKPGLSCVGMGHMQCEFVSCVGAREHCAWASAVSV